MNAVGRMLELMSDCNRNAAWSAKFGATVAELEAGEKNLDTRFALLLAYAEKTNYEIIQGAKSCGQ